MPPISLAILLCTMPSQKATVWAYVCPAVNVAHNFVLGDTAVALLKAGAETDKRDADGYLAIDLAPDKRVCTVSSNAFIF